MISESLLVAVLHLFAMQASRLRGADLEGARRRVLAYLNHHVGLSNAEIYIGLFDELTEVHKSEDDAVILENAGQMVGRLKLLLHGLERHAATLRFVELAAPAPEGTLPREIALRLGTELGMSADSVATMFRFLANPEACAQAADNGLILGGDDLGFRGRIAALQLAGEHLFLIAPVGDGIVRMEGRPVGRGECILLSPEQVLRDAWGNELHFARIAALFGGEVEAKPAITFRGEHLNFQFPGSDNGLHDFSFVEQSGRIIAIMGGSGTGKSTLLAILNGTIRPDSGALILNGRDVHKEPEAVEGVTGFVPQDDLLFEDLTVFENLYYAARLCMAHLPDEELVRRVTALLEDLGQADTAHQKVGSPLQATISGGQRKRLNIALELIREPPVLFVDEPTSGLSSADSDLVMSLLKQQAVRGKLVFVVIHQPSSKIFRTFDALWVLDQGGWPIFCGSPLESVAYFRTRGGLPGAEEAICSACGSVNPEQLFDIIEDKVQDDSGTPTRERRVAPETWYNFFKNYRSQRDVDLKIEDTDTAPEQSLHRPGQLGQLRVFFTRDLRARVSSRTYLAVTLLEPPLLGLLLGLVSRGSFGGTYSFHDNNNVHVFFFMSVMVSLFLGLSVSAEEICRDGKILRRERFLHLSWWSYINSKSFYLALVSALQMLLFLAVANPLVGVPGMFLKTWAILFAGAFSSCMLGLNISAAFRSAVTIYILIPLILIPQMLLCGVVISYDDLIAPHSRNRDVPRYANALPPRWAHEALVVEQYGQNAYMRHLVEPDAGVRMAEYDLDYYLPELHSLAQSIFVLRDQGALPARIAEKLNLLRLELASLEQRTGTASGLTRADFQPDAYRESTAQQVERTLADARRVIFERRRAAAADKRAVENRLTKALGPADWEALKTRHTNHSIEMQALNLWVKEPIGVAKDGLFQRTLPIYQTPESRFGESHFLARHKRIGDRLIPTYTFNLAAIHALTLLLYLALCFRATLVQLSAAIWTRFRMKRPA